MKKLRFLLFFAPDNATGGASAPAATEPAPAEPVAPAAPAEPVAPAEPAAPAAPAAPAEPVAPVEPAAPAAPEAPAAAAAPVTTRPNVFQRAGAFLTSQASLISQMGDLRSTIARLEADLTARDATISTQNAELVSLRAGRTQLEQTLDQLQRNQQTVADLAAAQGIPAAQLPASDPNAISAEASDAEKFAKYQTLKGGERTTYLREHKAALMRHEQTLKKGK